MIMLCISPCFWVLRAPKSWSKHFLSAIFRVLEVENATLSADREPLFFDWTVILQCTKRIQNKPKVGQCRLLYIRKQDGVHLSYIQMTFEYQTIWHSTSF